MSPSVALHALAVPTEMFRPAKKPGKPTDFAGTPISPSVQTVNPAILFPSFLLRGVLERDNGSLGS